MVFQKIFCSACNCRCTQLVPNLHKLISGEPIVLSVATMLESPLQTKAAPFRTGRGRCSLFVAAAVVLLAPGLAVAALGGELGGGEGNAAEQLAGVFSAARGVAALFGGDAVVHDGHNELCVPLQADDGELSQGHIEPPAVSLHGQVLVKHSLYPIRQLQGAVPSAALAGLPDPGTQYHGIQRFYNRCGAVCQISCDGIGGAGPQITAVDVGAAFLAAEDDALGKDRQAAQRGRTIGADNGVGEDAVVEGDVYTVVVPVKGHRLYIYVGAQQLGTADPGVCGAVQSPLRARSQVNRQVLDTVFVPTGIGDFPGVNGHCLAQLIGVAAQGIVALISHEIPS